jgi:hypothetical protein
MTYKEYTEEQKAEFCTLAQEIGIGRAIRELSFPDSYSTAVRWMTQRGVKPNIDKMMQNVKIWHTFYAVDDLLEQIDTAMAITQDILLKAETADDAKKIAEALQKLVNTRLLLEGKATSINEKRETSKLDLEIADLIAAEKAKNALLKDDVAVATPVNSV